MYGACFCALIPIKFLALANLAVDFGFLQGPTVHPPTQCLPAVEKKIDGPSSYDRRAAFFHCPESGGRKQSEDVGSKMQYCGTASTMCGRYMLHSPTTWVEVTKAALTV